MAAGTSTGSGAASRPPARMGALYEEHCLLGARFLPSDGQAHVAVASYASEREGACGGEGALLCDLTGTTYLLASGAAAPALVDAALAPGVPAVGRTVLGPVLSGTGSVVSVPLVVRCGDTECVLVDATGRGPALEDWLGFLRDVEQDGRAPFAGATVEDATDSLVPLLVAGPAARHVLLDYVRTGEVLPGPGAVAAVRLDAIPAVVACPPAGAAPGLRGASYLVLVPPVRARALWRSLLSFREVEPLGIERLRALMGARLPWAPALATASDARPTSRTQLASWGLPCRADGFVGARALEP